MENNEENLGSQEPETTNSTSSNSVKTTNTKLIGIVVVAVLAILAIFFMFFTKSAKSVVKDYVKAFNKGNAKKVVNTTDYEGMAAFRSLAGYSLTVKDEKLKDFDKTYEDMMDELKDLDKDEKKEYEEDKEDTIDDRIDSLQDQLDEMKDEKVKMSIKNIKTKKVDGSKKLTKVTATLVVKVDGEKEEEDVTFYTMKKGFKNYIVSAGF